MNIARCPCRHYCCTVKKTNVSAHTSQGDTTCDVRPPILFLQGSSQCCFRPQCGARALPQTFMGGGRQQSAVSWGAMPVWVGSLPQVLFARLNRAQSNHRRSSKAHENRSYRAVRYTTNEIARPHGRVRHTILGTKHATPIVQYPWRRRGTDICHIFGHRTCHDRRS